MRILLLLSWLYSCYSYNENIAIHGVNLAQAAYSVSNLNDWNCKTCDSSVILTDIVEKNGVKALQGYDSYTDCIFTSFRGSSNIQNWISNIQISKVNPYNDTAIAVSKGFYKDYNYIKSDLMDNLSMLKREYNTNNVLLTGHSLGAALATLMAFDILNEFQNYNLKYLTTYGSPRVGNKEFSSIMNGYDYTSYRVTHYYDIVPHVPEEFMGYSHISNEIWYNEENSEYTICNDKMDEDDKCSNSCSPTKCTSTSDHLYYLNVTMGNI